MSTKILMDVEEYLRTSFEGPDCEYLDGEVVERNMGELPHGDLQTNLSRLLFRFRGAIPLIEDICRNTLTSVILCTFQSSTSQHLLSTFGIQERGTS